jgi:hypothetical protein
LRAALALLLFSALAPALASPENAPAGVASADSVIAKVKAEHPGAKILKIELTRGEDADLPEWIYEVKLFPPDGRILRLTYDARSLALVETAGPGSECRRGGGPARLRLRRGWRRDSEAKE